MKLHENSLVDRYIRVLIGILLAVAVMSVVCYGIFAWSFYYD